MALTFFNAGEENYYGENYMHSFTLNEISRIYEYTVFYFSLV